MDANPFDAVAERAVEKLYDRIRRDPVEPRTWFSAQGAALYMGLSEQTLSRYLKEGKAPKSVLIAKNARRFHRDDLDAWIRAGGVAREAA